MRYLKVRVEMNGSGFYRVAGKSTDRRGIDRHMLQVCNQHNEHESGSISSSLLLAEVSRAAVHVMLLSCRSVYMDRITTWSCSIYQAP